VQLGDPSLRLKSGSARDDAPWDPGSVRPGDDRERAAA
jgi:hypothetical protein